VRADIPICQDLAVKDIPDRLKPKSSLSDYIGRVSEMGIDSKRSLILAEVCFWMTMTILQLGLGRCADVLVCAN
jgi:hypothetical protein